MTWPNGDVYVINAGVALGRFIDSARLKKGFGYFIIAMAVFIFIMEFIL